MSTISCRNCGQVAESFEDSQWCLACVRAEMDEQAAEDVPYQEPEIISLLESA